VVGATVFRLSSRFFFFTFLLFSLLFYYLAICSVYILLAPCLRLPFHTATTATSTVTTVTAGKHRCNIAMQCYNIGRAMNNMCNVSYDCRLNYLASIFNIFIIRYRDRYARELIIYVHTSLSVRVGAILSSWVPHGPTHDARGAQ